MCPLTGRAQGAALPEQGCWLCLWHSVRIRCGIVATVHPLQVLDEALPQTAHDFRVDLIVTPDEVIQAAHPRPSPGIIWADLEADKIRSIPWQPRARVVRYKW
jgi:hypothetical protein